ncbi:BTB domain containing 3, partial [Aphelenchoides avenae]
CWTFIDENTVDVLGSEKFLDVSHSLLKEILGRQTLKVREIFLYNNAYNWADAELKRQSRAVTDKAIRDVLGDALYLIRFPQMHPKEFPDGSEIDSVAEGPEAEDVLTMNEKYEILRWYATGRPPKSSSFTYTPRNAAGPLPSVPARSCHSCGYRSEDALVGPCPQCGQKTRLGDQCIGCGVSFIVVGEVQWAAGSCRNGGADCSVLAYRCPCGAVNATEDDEHECFRCKKKAYVCRCGERDWPNASDEKCDACDEWA